VQGMGESCPFEFNFDQATFKVGDLVSYRVTGSLDGFPFVGTLLEVQFQVTVPTVALSNSADIFAGDKDQVALFIYVNFMISGREVRGYFGLVLGVETFAVLKEVLAAFLKKVL